MADEKLSELTELAATPEANDELYIRDESELAVDESKRITVGKLMSIKIATKTTNYTITTESLILADATSGAITIKFPNAATYPGEIRRIKKIDEYNTVTVETDGGNIDGNSSIPLYSQGAYIVAVSDGTNWHIIATSLMLG